jgi:ABC-type transport system involved in cytochrome bd biosynthesis fused ATPase/permease subunit
MKGMQKKDNFIFWFLLAINISLTIKLFVEQADAILLSVLVLTTFLLILTLKVNSARGNERQTLKEPEETLEKVSKIVNSESDNSDSSAENKAQNKLNQIQQIVNKKPNVLDWHSTAVFLAILINNAILFAKLLLSTEPQAGILITIAIMAGLLLLTLRVDSLEFQKEFPFLTFSKVQ